jgi:phosphomannomutase
VNVLGVFKAYDIRGIYPSELNDGFAYTLARALVVFLKAKKLIVGRDVRNSSAALHSRFVQGLVDQGCDVEDIGVCSTNMLYYASRKGDAAMITASHTPKEYNGFKLCRKGAIPIGSDSGLKDIEKSMVGNPKQSAKKGTVRQVDILDEFVEDVAAYAHGIGKIKIVVDAGNGAASIAIEKIAKSTGIEIVPLYFEPDGNFPGRGPNPLVEGATDSLKKKVLSTNADFGVAYDADCDRVFFIDEKGEQIAADLITALIAEQLLKKNPESTILYDLRSSWSVKEQIAALGGKAVVTRVGHSFIKEKMRQTNAIFAGELSGHYYYASNSYADSGDITLVLMAGLVSSSGRKLSELVKPLKKYYPSGEINFEVKDKDAKIAQLKNEYRDGKISELDGVSVEFSDWWFNVRPSNTEPLLRLNVEARNKKELERRLKEITGLIKE